MIADGLDNHRVIIADSNGKYISEFGGFGTEPGQFNGVHSVAAGPNGLIFALDRSGGRVNVYRTTEDAVWLTDLNLYDGDNQYGRTQKLVPKPDADPVLIIGQPWVAH